MIVLKKDKYAILGPFPSIFSTRSYLHKAVSSALSHQVQRRSEEVTSCVEKCLIIPKNT